MLSRPFQSAIVAACFFASIASVAFAAPAAGEVLTPLQQKQSEESVDRALRWLASQQRSDGAFPAPDSGQPGVTGLCVLAFLAHGDLPGQGTRGGHIDRAIDYILSCSLPDGMLNRLPPEPIHRSHGYSRTGMYNHAIAATALAEVYGMADREMSQRMKPTIERARDFTLMRQQLPKKLAKDRGGWRYIHGTNEHESDLAITSWQMLFLRSMKNAGFAIPPLVIEQALNYVERTFDASSGAYVYIIDGKRSLTRAMAGAGILSMSLAGKHDTVNARLAGDWLLAHPFNQYRQSYGRDRYFYGLFYCSQAMFQLGGNHWRKFFPPAVAALLANQSPDGSWDDEPVDNGMYGNAYTTALAVLALETPHQLLPIFQR